MALPSNPAQGDLGTLNGSNYVYDSDNQRWLLTNTNRELTLEAQLDSDVSVLRSLLFDTAASAGFPVGSVVAFAVGGSLPTGFLLADGSSFSKSTYPELFAFLDSEVLPNYTNRTFGYKTYDQEDSNIYPEVVFGIAAYNGAGLISDSDLLRNAVQTYVSDFDSDILVLQNRVTELEGDLAQAVADRVYTDNLLSARLDAHDSDIALKGRFYVQATAPSGGPNSGWVNTTTMRLNVWDETASTWIEVALT